MLKEIFHYIYCMSIPSTIFVLISVCCFWNYLASKCISTRHKKIWNSLNFILSACMLFLSILKETSEENMHFRICIDAADPVRPKVYFFYYRLAEGLHLILSKARTGIRNYYKPLRPNQRQMRIRGFA